MIDSSGLLDDARDVVSTLVDDLRARTDEHEESRVHVRGVYERAVSAERTDKTFEQWREDLLAQVAVGWVLSSVFIRFAEDNGLYDTPLLSGPGDRKRMALDHRAEFFAADHTAGDREWLVEVVGRYRHLPGIGPILGEHNPMWQIAPSADGAKAILDLWTATADDGVTLRHDFRDPNFDTRFLGDLYQDLSEHARKQYALLQTPEFVESFILDRAFEPAVETFGIGGFRMIDPTCGSGHFLLGGFERLLERWRQAEPATNVRELAQRALDSVAGVDINPFAVAVARFRLLVAALQASQIDRLLDAPNFTINVATGDSLLHGTRPGTMLTGMQELAGTAVEHHYPTEDGQLANELLEADGYHVVVGNPPYITVKDKALNTAYRALYETCYMQYSLSVPFMERFFQLARPEDREGPAGWVGQITSNSFMKRQFGRKLIEEYLPTIDLLEVIDTSGAYIPGHGTPTVVLVGRNRKPSSDTVRAVLGIRGEPGRPQDPATAKVWTSIVMQIDQPGAEDDFTSVDDAPIDRFRKHPWSLQGGVAPVVLAAVQQRGLTALEELISETGASIYTRADDLFLTASGAAGRFVDFEDQLVGFLAGTDVRDWYAEASQEVLFPYEELGRSAIKPIRGKLLTRLWPHRSRLLDRREPNGSIQELGMPWYGWARYLPQRHGHEVALAHAFVATHNHFVLDRGGKVFNRSAPVIKLPEEASEDDHLGLLGLLNSSTAGFWMKQVFHNKGEGGGARVDAGYSAMGSEEWRNTYEFDSTKLKEFPVPSGRPLPLTRRLDGLARDLAEVLPAAVAEGGVPTDEALVTPVEEAAELRTRMVALQEELDWQVYGIYGLTDDELTAKHPDDVPSLARGERAFEIVLARQVDVGEVETSWFERHGSTPITDLPDDWPEAYRDLVQRRIDLIESDRTIRLLEKPEHKRRWYWDDLDDLATDAQEQWLADRIESYVKAGDPAVTTVARLADQLADDDDARQVAEDLEGTGADLVDLVARLVADDGVPYLAALRHNESGLRKRAQWERTWALQRSEDALDARAALPGDDDDHLTDGELEVAKKEAGVEDIPVPPKYVKADWRSATAYRLRGKLDVPKERFIIYPGTRVGADTSAVVGWAGWDHLQQARVLAGHFTQRKHDGAEPDELVPLLAGIDELVPWVIQWHNDLDPQFGERMGEFLAGFVDTEAAGLTTTRNALSGWRP